MIFGSGRASRVLRSAGPPETVLPGLITPWKLPPSRKVRVIAKTRSPELEARGGAT